MMITRKLFHFYQNKRSWKTSKKIIVFESDDWGTIRMPSIYAKESLARRNLAIKNDPYSLFDCLESSDDLTALYDVLRRHRNTFNEFPVFTFNTIVGNPEFEKIKKSGFNEYYFELFTDTLINTSRYDNTWNLWREGIENKLIIPQFHGREHVNVFRWLAELRMGNKELLNAFDYGCFSIPYYSVSNGRKNLMAALDLPSTLNYQMFQENYIREGQKLFESIFGFRSKSFIAPAYIWNKSIHNCLYESEIQFIQGIAFQHIPTNFGKYKKVLNYTGKKIRPGLTSLVRNAFFEPSLESNTDVVGNCLSRITKLFEENRPAIIGSHRLNYIGTLNSSNRKNNLEKLNVLLAAILKHWPDVIFLSSDQLGLEIISNKH